MKFCNVCGSVLSLQGDLNSKSLSELTKKKKILLSDSNPMKYCCDSCEILTNEPVETLTLQQTLNTKECEMFFKTIISPYIIYDDTYPILDKSINICCPDCSCSTIKYVSYEDHYWMLVYICCDCYCTWYLRNGLSGQTLQKINLFV